MKTTLKLLVLAVALFLTQASATESRNIEAVMIAITSTLLSSDSESTGVQADNPPWAPASCSIIFEGDLYLCWCETPDEPTGCRLA